MYFCVCSSVKPVNCLIYLRILKKSLKTLRLICAYSFSKQCIVVFSPSYPRNLYQSSVSLVSLLSLAVKPLLWVQSIEAGRRHDAVITIGHNSALCKPTGWNIRFQRFQRFQRMIEQRLCRQTSSFITRQNASNHRHDSHRDLYRQV